MRLVIIESPYAGDAKTPEERERVIARNMRYLHRAILDCIRRGESPYASHLMLTTALNDADETERKLGIEAGFMWRAKAAATVIYTDHGISSGMRLGIEDAVRERETRVQIARGPHAIEYRSIGAEAEESEAA